MIRAARLAAAVASAAIVLARADEEAHEPGRRAAAPSQEAWSFAATGYWNAPHGTNAFASGIFAADRGALHLEARANYEAVHAQSAFVGWTFSTGDAVSLEVTPIVGGVTGATRGPIVGLEATISAGSFDTYIEAEHVRPSDGQSEYTYAWTELGWRPVSWLRLGAVGQRTRLYGGERSVQGGAFVQFSHAMWTLSAYAFDPGGSSALTVVSLGFAM